jgi:hypothetical protein
VYERFDASSIAEADDARFDYFCNKVCACIGCLTVYWTWFHFDRSCSNEVFYQLQRYLEALASTGICPLFHTQTSFELYNPLNHQLQRIPGES